MWSEVRYRLGWPFRLRARRRRHDFLRKIGHCREMQAKSLQRILDLNATSEFSRRHRLHAGLTPDEFRRRVPITTYDDYRPYIDRLRSGDHEALLGPDNRLLMFGLSSGTTSAAKYIPITTEFLKSYRRGWQVWGIGAMDDHPRLHRLNILQLSSDHEQFIAEDGTPCGNISGLVSASQLRVVRSMYTLPVEIAKIREQEAKTYVSLRYALANPYIGMAITANPSTLVHLAQFGQRHADSLLRDIADGTLSAELPSPLREQLTCGLRPNPARASELVRLAEAAGTLRPSDAWPHLQLLGVWTGGSAAVYLPELERYYGPVPVRDHGLSASEGRMTIPVTDGQAAGLLDIDAHYFEFVPEEEHGAADAVTLAAQELTVGQNYYILMTTPSGFYRYDIHDVVQCVGYEGTTPLLRFLHKGAHISNLTGEKLAESQVVESVASVAERLGQPLRRFSVAPAWSDPPYYELMCREGELSSRQAESAFAMGVESALQFRNWEYKEKRASGRLSPLRVTSIPQERWDAFVHSRQTGDGRSVEQYKHPYLIPDMTVAAGLRGNEGPSAPVISTEPRATDAANV